MAVWEDLRELWEDTERATLFLSRGGSRVEQMSRYSSWAWGIEDTSVQRTNGTALIYSMRHNYCACILHIYTTYFYRGGGYLRWWRLFKAEHSPPLSSHFSITEQQRQSGNVATADVSCISKETLWACLCPGRRESKKQKQNRFTWQRSVCRQWTQVWSSIDGKWCSSESAAKSTADLWSESDSSRIYPFQTALLRREQ